MVNEHHSENDIKNFNDALAFTNKVGNSPKGESSSGYLSRLGKGEIDSLDHKIDGLTESDLCSPPRWMRSVSGFWFRSKRVILKGKIENDRPLIRCSWTIAFQHCWRARIIPDALRINHRHRPLNANPQAIRFRAINQRFGPGEFEFLQPLLQKFPSFQSGFPWARNNSGRSGPAHRKMCRR